MSPYVRDEITRSNREKSRRNTACKICFNFLAAFDSDFGLTLKENTTVKQLLQQVCRAEENFETLYNQL